MFSGNFKHRNYSVGHHKRYPGNIFYNFAYCEELLSNELDWNVSLSLWSAIISGISRDLFPRFRGIWLVDRFEVFDVLIFIDYINVNSANFWGWDYQNFSYDCCIYFSVQEASSPSSDVDVANSFWYIGLFPQDKWKGKISMANGCGLGDIFWPI